MNFSRSDLKKLKSCDNFRNDRFENTENLPFSEIPQVDPLDLLLGQMNQTSSNLLETFPELQSDAHLVEFQEQMDCSFENDFLESNSFDHNQRSFTTFSQGKINTKI